MIYFLDTNHLVRFIVRDNKPQAQKVRSLIKSSRNFYIPSVVLAETVYISTNQYLAKKNVLCDALLTILRQDNIASPAFCINAIEIYKKENISFYDCLIIAEALETSGTLKTFDTKMLQIWKKYKNQPF